MAEQPEAGSNPPPAESLGEFQLELEPPTQLRFHAPFEEPMVVELKISNGSAEKAMVSKVKCTDNDVFRIRPVVAMIPPKESTICNITATLKDGKLPRGRPHHFLVTHTEAADPSKKPREVWKEAMEGEQRKFPEKRLDAVFDPSPLGAAAGGAAPEAPAGGEAQAA